MKLLTFIAALCFIGVVSASSLELLQEHAEVQGLIDGLINDTINALTGNVSDPMLIDEQDLKFSEDLLSGYANISNFQLYGLKGIVASKIDVPVLSLAMNATIQIPEIMISSKYDANVSLVQLIPLYGAGQINVTLKDIELLVSGRVDISNGLSISDVTVVITLSDAMFDLHGLFKNEDFSAWVNEILNETVVVFINENTDDISHLISPILGELINSLLKQKKNSTL